MAQFFRAGTTYTLRRKGSRPLEMDLIVSWTDPGRKPGKRVRSYLFSLGKRQAAKYGMKTKPKLHADRCYPVERQDQKWRCLRLEREKIGWYGTRILWFKLVNQKRCPNSN